MKDAPEIDEVFHREGDRPHGGGGGHPGKADRWGARFLLVFDPAVGTTQRKVATFVDSTSFREPQLFFLQVRFASALPQLGGSFIPALPWQDFSSSRIKFTIKRQLDDYSGIVENEYIVNGFSPSVLEPTWFPLSHISARKLIVLAEIIDDAPGHGGQFVDVVATRVTSIDSKLLISQRPESSLFGVNVFGFGRTNAHRIAASAAPVDILVADASRRSFFITNVSTTKRLALRFSDLGNPSFAPGLEEWDVVLAAGGQYQAPLDFFWGPVRGVWEAGFGVGDCAVATSAGTF